MVTFLAARSKPLVLNRSLAICMYLRVLNNNSQLVLINFERERINKGCCCCEETCESMWPLSSKSLVKQVQLAVTCGFLRLLEDTYAFGSI